MPRADGRGGVLILVIDLFGSFEFFSYLCLRIKEDIMSDDNKDIVDEEIDDLDWDRMPIFGPKTEDEAIARIEQAWEDRNDPSKWMTSEQMWNHLYEKHPWLR